MFNFIFPWTKRCEARKAAEQEAREEAAVVSFIVAANKRETDRRLAAQLAAQRARASTISSPGRTGLASVPLSGYSAELRHGEPAVDAPMAAAMRGYFDSAPASAPSHLVACGGTFDGGDASSDWGGSNSSSGSDSPSGSSDSDSGSSSD